jgi:hypothetical protein
MQKDEKEWCTEQYGKRKIKDLKGKEKVKLPLFVDDVIFYT